MKLIIGLVVFLGVIPMLKAEIFLDKLYGEPCELKEFSGKWKSASGERVSVVANVDGRLEIQLHRAQKQEAPILKKTIFVRKIHSKIIGFIQCKEGYQFFMMVRQGDMVALVAPNKVKIVDLFEGSEELVVKKSVGVPSSWSDAVLSSLDDKALSKLFLHHDQVFKLSSILLLGRTRDK